MAISSMYILGPDLPPLPPFLFSRRRRFHRFASAFYWISVSPPAQTLAPMLCGYPRTLGLCLSETLAPDSGYRYDTLACRTGGGGFIQKTTEFFPKSPPTLAGRRPAAPRGAANSTPAGRRAA